MDTNSICESLRQCTSNVTIQWVPGHAGVPGNEAADAAAKQATSISGPNRNISFKSACASIRRHFNDIRTHERTIEVYASYSKEKEKQVKTRADQVTLAQLRSGQHKAFNEYKHKKLDDTIDPLCPLCKAENHNLEHWMKCEGTAAMRQKLFGTIDSGLGVLCQEPTKSLALARSTLLGARDPQG